MIKVDDGYYIKTDGNGLVAIKTMVAKKSGNENTKVIGYYTTFENALKGIEDVFDAYTKKNAVNHQRAESDY